MALSKVLKYQKGAVGDGSVADFAKRTNFGIPNEINAVRFLCARPVQLGSRIEPPALDGACHRASRRPDPVGRPDDKLREIRVRPSGISLRSIRATSGKLSRLLSLLHGREFARRESQGRKNMIQAGDGKILTLRSPAYRRAERRCRCRRNNIDGGFQHRQPLATCWAPVVRK